MKKILVTGGMGYIGSHTCVELIEQGYDVVILDNLCNSSILVLEKIERITGTRPKFYECNILDITSVENVFEQEQNIEGVIHFAALKAVGKSVENPLKYYETNIIGTLNILKIMEMFNCKRIVFSSSATVYGMDNIPPYDENMPTSATNPYGYTKVMAEQILLDIAKADCEFSTAILRYFNPIGAHNSGLIGENPNGIPNNLLPYIMEVAIGKLESLNVFGDDYDTPDGTGIRDYIHVVDLAKGHIKAIEYLFENTDKIIINLGTGIGSSVLDVIKIVEKVTQKNISYKICPRRAGDISISYSSVDNAKNILNWEATETLEEMCRSSWNFIQNKSNIYIK